MLVVFCDFAAIITLAVEAIAIPHNTICLLGSRGLTDPKMYLLQDAISPIIAVVITIMVDWEKLRRER